MINLLKHKIGTKYKPFIVAEMSGNHNGSLKRALMIVKKAAECGVSAIKLQTYTPDTMTFKSNKKDFLITSKKSIWKGKNLYDLYKIAQTPWEWHERIFNEAKKYGLVYFSTPFDETSIKFLQKFFAELIFKLCITTSSWFSLFSSTMHNETLTFFSTITTFFIYNFSYVLSKNIVAWIARRY